MAGHCHAFVDLFEGPTQTCSTCLQPCESGVQCFCRVVVCKRCHDAERAGRWPARLTQQEVVLNLHGLKPMFTGSADPEDLATLAALDAAIAAVERPVITEDAAAVRIAELEAQVERLRERLRSRITAVA